MAQYVKVEYKGQDLAYYGPVPFINFSTNTIRDSAGRDALGYQTSITLEGKIYVPRKMPYATNDSVTRNQMGIQNLAALEGHMRDVFTRDGGQGLLRLRCNNTDMNFGLVGPAKENNVAKRGIWCKVSNMSFNRSNDNWTSSIDYTIELEHFTMSGVKHQCAKSFPVVSYNDDWSIEPLDDPSYYHMNTQNNLLQLGNIFTNVYPVGNNKIENLKQYRITHKISAVGAYAPTGEYPVGQAEGGGSAYYDTSPWLNAKNFVQCQVTRGNDELNHIFLMANNNAFGHQASFQNDSSRITGGGSTAESEPKVYLYNHTRLVNVSEAAGSYEISDTWLAMSKPAAYTEQYSIEVSQDVNYNTTARINGSVQGLELKRNDYDEENPFGNQANHQTRTNIDGSSKYQPKTVSKDNEITLKSMNETNIAKNKYDNALYAWRNYVEPMMYVRAHTFTSMTLDGRNTTFNSANFNRNSGTNGATPVAGIDQNNTPVMQYTAINNGCPTFNKHAADILLDPQPLSKTIGSDPSKGTITYSCEFNSRTGANQIKGGRILSLSVQDSKGSDRISEVFVLGRKRGPALVDSGSKTAKSRQLNIEIQTNIPKGVTEFDMRFNDCPMYTGGIVYKDVLNLVDMFRPVMSAGWTPIKLQEAAAAAAARGQTVSVPVGSATVGQLYVIQNEETWNPLEGKFTKNITWKYDV